MSPPAVVEDPLPDEVDVVVVGAGHNGLVCAAYLAAAGLEVAVLEAGATPGGNTRTEELTLPGFAHDTCSSAHVLIQNNPLIADDELGLRSAYGLDYILTEPAVVLPQPDGDTLVMHRDLDATVDELARWSAPDAHAFRALVDEWTGGLSAVHSRWSSALPLPEGAATDRYLALRSRSAWDVVHERFSHPTVRSFVLWLAMATIQDPRRSGSGFLPSSLTVGRLQHGWATPRGGSQQLPEVLIRFLRDRGSTVHCGASVAGIDATGRVEAVRTADGRRVRVRKGVVSSAHLGLLASLLDGDAPAPDLADARARWRPGLSVFAVHAALSGDLGFPTRSGQVQAAAAGLGSTTGMVRQIDAHNEGRPDARDPWLLVVNQTVVDPGRAPAGAGTLKLLTIAPYTRSDGRDWATAKDEYAEALLALVRKRASGPAHADVLAVRAESPVDVAAANPHNLGGSCHGGEFLMADGSVAGGWPGYRTSVPGLYLTGSTAHPGGSVSGRPGRNAARVVLEDLGLDPGRVMALR